MNIFKKLINRLSVPKDEYTITLIEKDFLGDRCNPYDCRGARALKRASGKKVFWQNDLGYIGGKRYRSTTPEGPAYMMGKVNVGDTITFKRED